MSTTYPSSRKPRAIACAVRASSSTRSSFTGFGSRPAIDGDVSTPTRVERRTIATVWQLKQREENFRLASAFLQLRSSATRVLGEVAGDTTTVDLAQSRFLDDADVLDERTARAEPAAARHVARVRWLALECEVLRDPAAADARHGGQQRARVRMARLREHRRRVAQL